MSAEEHTDHGDNINVCARFRPLSRTERERDTTQCVAYPHDDAVDLTIEEEETTHSFTYSKVFKADISQKDVYESVGAPIVKDVLNGYNGTVFVYGQTGSGKTHTMMGPQVHAPKRESHVDANSTQTSHANAAPVYQFHTDQDGIIPRAIDDLFDRMKKASSDLVFEVQMYFVEIYMEHVRDLLELGKASLNVREDPSTQSFYVEGCAMPFVSDAQEVLDYIQKGLANRSTASTKMNSESSRSHCLLGLHIKSNNTHRGEHKMGKMFMVDLAGSEKVGKTGAVGQQLEEAKMINKSLSTLGNVINALVEARGQKGKHIPYRDSKLTKILQDSLGGNSRTALVVCCSPSSYNDQETLSTLRFGQRAKKIQNRAVQNKTYTMEELLIMLQKAEAEINMLRKGGAGTGGDGGMEAVKMQARLEEQERYFDTRVREMEDEQRELEGERDSAKRVVASQQGLIESQEEEIDAWQQEYSILMRELRGQEQTANQERDGKNTAVKILHDYLDATSQSKAEVEGVRVLCSDALREATDSISRSANQAQEVRVVGEQRVQQLQHQLQLVQENFTELEARWKEAQDDNGGLVMELDMMEKRLAIRNERVENLKKGLRREMNDRLDAEQRAAKEKESLIQQLTEARSDAELWRSRFESLSSASSAMVNTRIVKHVRGSTSGTFQ